MWGQRQHTLASRLTIVSTLDLGNSWKGRADIARGCRVDEVDEMEVTGIRIRVNGFLVSWRTCWMMRRFFHRGDDFILFGFVYFVYVVSSGDRNVEEF